MDYIINNLADIHHLTTFPLISTLILLTVIPFISNGAYWLSLKFNKWKKDKKNIVDMKQLLTIEQSIDLREQISKQEERFDKLLENKNSEIKQLNAKLNEFTKTLNRPGIEVKANFDENIEELTELSKRIKGDPNENIMYDELTRYIQGGYSISRNEKINSKFISLLESYEIIKNNGKGNYEFTAKGKKLQKLMSK